MKFTFTQIGKQAGMMLATVAMSLWTINANAATASTDLSDETLAEMYCY